LGEEFSTLEVDAGEVDAQLMLAAEELANRVLWENRRVRTYIVEPSEARRLPLRKAPAVDGPVRLVDIEGFDLDPCSGTHVATTGEVGLVKIVGKEKLRGHVRFRFLAGLRAWRDYAQKSSLVEEVAAELTTGESELLAAVRKLCSEQLNACKQLRAMQERFLTMVREQVLSQPDQSGVQVLQGLDGIEWALVRKLAFQLLDAGLTAVIVAQSAPSVRIAAGTGASGVDLRTLVPEVCAILGGKGGGRPGFVEVAGDQAARLGDAIGLLRAALVRVLPGTGRATPAAIHT
jgi:alanyl-tRNA synthetase